MLQKSGNKLFGKLAPVDTHFPGKICTPTPSVVWWLFASRFVNFNGMLRESVYIR